MKIEIRKSQEIEYLIRYPENYQSEQKYPVIFFLHGAGTRGNDIELLKNSLFFKITEKYEGFPFITVAPQCHSNTWFDLFEQLKVLVSEIAKADFVDSERIYLMGTSMGAYATWQLSMSLPELFAAIVPICGGGMYWNAARLSQVAVWAFHGAKDSVVFVEESVKMVEAINSAGGNAKLTIYPENQHDAWTDTYSNYEVFQWLLRHQNNFTQSFNDAFRDSLLYG